MSPNDTNLLKLIRQTIDARGYSVVAAESSDSGVACAYTVGLAEKDLPEFVIFGLEPSASAKILGAVAERAMNGEVFVNGQRYDELLPNRPCEVMSIAPNYFESVLSMASEFSPYGHLQSAFQLVWPDEQGRFPGESGYDERLFVIQPLMPCVH